ncbi:hypothetical protein BH20CHL3_BH20CHL3_07270 [soil metagenome]
MPCGLETLGATGETDMALRLSLRSQARAPHHQPGGGPGTKPGNFWPVEWLGSTNWMLWS